MNKNEKIVIEYLIKSLIKEEVDKALTLSNKRRKEFKNQWLKKEQTNDNSLSNLEQDINNSLGNLDGNNNSSLPNNNNNQQPDNGLNNNPTDNTSATPDMGDNDDNKDAPTDPLEDIKISALELAEKTKDPAEVLKLVKSKIQDRFQSYEEANKVIEALRETGDGTLLKVAERLQMFLGAK